jgi:NAD(P)-dependent dehydrogenase (short-subunit alcohol dehydrogenase family)
MHRINYSQALHLFGIEGTIFPFFTKSLMLRKQFLIIGGTDGIGKATAIRLASKGADITITGRNQEKANATLDQCKSTQLEPSQKFQFHSLDVTNIKNVYNYCQGISGKLDGVLLCAGGLNYGPRRVTSEGIEMTFAQNYLSRFVFMKYLAPKLQGSRIIHCLGAGNGFGVNFDDIQLESSSYIPFFMRAAVQSASLGDVIVKELAKRMNNEAQFFHFNPGVVNTNSAKNQGFPFLIHYAGSFVLPWIANSPEKISEKLEYILTSPEFGKKELNGSMVGETCNILQYKEKDPLAGEKLYKYTNELVEKLIQ